MIAIQSYYRTVKHVAVKAIVPLLFIGGIVSALVGLAITGLVGPMAGLSLLLCGIAAVATAQIIELLRNIESSLATMREQMSKGVLGLLSH